MPVRLPSLTFKSYGLKHEPHVHDHVQIVLPVQGELELEVEGAMERVHRGAGILLPPGTRHDQSSCGANRFLIVDFDSELIHARRLADLAKRPVLPISEAAHRLIQFANLSASLSNSVAGNISRHVLPLLLDTLLEQAPTPTSRLSSLLLDVERSLDRDWTTANMTRAYGMSQSRLYTLFQTELGTTPQLWLTETRLLRAQHLLVHSGISIAEIALQLGYSDQSALTRAMRRELNQTPAAYRRLHRQ